MAKYKVYQDIKILMEEKFIEAKDEDEAEEKFIKMVENGEVKEMDRDCLDVEVFEATEQEIKENDFA